MKVRPVVVIAILFVSLVVLRLYLNKSNEGFQGSNKEVVICKADWCGHCKKAAPEFQKLVGASPLTLQDGTTATVKLLDADQDKSEISKYKVRGYPTILVVNGGQTTEYPGERSYDGVLSFLNSL
jgi:thiol-disulfide isomerase/thioredoxin